MPTRRQTPEPKRRIPRQARSGATVEAILEAAAQILEGGGLAVFTTNAVAERAGVSIGTLYQYFADKRALLVAIARQEMETAIADVGRALQIDRAQADRDTRVRALVRALVNAFRGRQRARKAVVQAILAEGLGGEMMQPVTAFIAATGGAIGRQPRSRLPPLSEEQVFVLSRALLGTVRAAVLEEQPFLRGARFEDEMVRLVVAYLDSVETAGPSPSRN